MPAVALFGYHEYAALALEELLRLGAEVVALVTHEDNPNETIWFRTPAPLAQRRGIPVYTPEDCNTPRFVATLKSLSPDLILSCYYRQLICDEILALPPLGALNLHGSLLPRYRGRAPVNWVLVNGETETGVTLHHMVRQADAGDIVAQVRVPIAFTDTALTLHRKLMTASRRLLQEFLPAVLAGTAPRRPQDHSRATVFGRRTPADGEIDWQAPAESIYNLVRAVTRPYPGAFTHARGKRLFVWKAWPESPATPAAAPGTVAECGPDGVFVATGLGRLRLDVLQLEGEEERPATEAVLQGWIRPGEKLPSD